MNISMTNWDVTSMNHQRKIDHINRMGWMIESAQKSSDLNANGDGHRLDDSRADGGRVRLGVPAVVVTLLVTAVVLWLLTTSTLA